MSTPSECIHYFCAPNDLHPATADLVARFATAMAIKLRAAERKHGYSDDWLDPSLVVDLRADLLTHIAKGDPLDVANYCAFLWHHQAPISAPASPTTTKDLHAD